MQKAVCLAVLLLAFAIPVRLAANGGSNADCYPGNAKPKTITSAPLVLATGATSAKGEAKGTLEEVELDTHGVETDAVDSTTPTPLVVSAKVELEFEANIAAPNTGTGGVGSTGRADATFKWSSPLAGGITQTEFYAGCVQDIETAHQAGIVKPVKFGSFHGEYEGSVENFPGYPGATKAAVLSVDAFEDPDNPGRVEVDFSIELNITCFENVYITSTPLGDAGDDIETEKISLKNLEADEFKINNVGRHGRASLPDPLRSGASTSCPSLTFGQ